MKLTLRRTGALGDVILATPVLRRLRQRYPQAEIAFETAYPDVFRHNPHLGGPESGEDDLVYNLDLAYERQPQLHVVEAYMQVVFGDRGDRADWRPELFPRYTMRMPDNAIAVHAAVAGWYNRTLPRVFWKRVLQLLCDEGFWPVLVGTEQDRVFGFECTTFNSPDLMAQASVIRACKGFIGSDSSLMHVASAMGGPMVGIFTSVDPATRLPFEPDRCRAVVADMECIGCHNRRPPPVTMEACERGDTACIKAVRPEAVIEALMEMVQS